MQTSTNFIKIRIMKQLLLFILCITFSSGALAQDGSLDTTFNPLDPGFMNGYGANSFIETIAVQDDGKILIGGWFGSYNSTVSSGLARLNSDGSVDTSFNTGTGINTESYYTIDVLTIQDDGKILIGGNFTTYNGASSNKIARLNSDGSLDTTFNVGTGADATIETLSVQDDGKILIGGQFTSYNGSASNNIARLNSDGSIDASFNVGTGASSWVKTLSILEDGKILIGGIFSSYNGISSKKIARLNSDGSLDTSFNVGYGANSIIETLSVQDDGKILIGGWFTSYNGTASNRIARLNSDGSLDTSFNVGTGVDNDIETLAIQSDGKILIGGLFSSYNGTASNRLARLNSDGSLDTSFDVGTGPNYGYSINTLLILDDGNILIGGSFTSYNGLVSNHLAYLNSDGSLDTSFNKSTGVFGIIETLSIQSDEKILIGGSFTGYNGTVVNRIARLNNDGSLDTSFDVGAGTNNDIDVLLVQNDGKILIGGWFTTYNDTASNKIARLNSDGSLDTSFNTGTGPNYGINTLSIQSDGKILIGGSFTTYNDTASNRLARLNNDGSLDTSFDVGTGADNSINTLYIQDDGKILISGFFTSYNGTESNRLARLNSDGSLDTSFNVGEGVDSSISSLTIQSDGKILIGGHFTSYNGTALNRIARLNSDGSLDTSFDVGSGVDSTIGSLLVQNDGKILIAGSFTTYNGTATNRIARLNSDGSLDTSFDVGTGVDEFVKTLSIQNDEKIIISVWFSSYNEVGRNRIARINTSVLNVEEQNTSIFKLYPNPAKNQFTIQLENPSELQNVSIYNNIGQLILTSKETSIDSSNLASGLYLVKIETTKGKGSKKMIIE